MGEFAEAIAGPNSALRHTRRCAAKRTEEDHQCGKGSSHREDDAGVKPAQATHWSTRSMAEAQGVSDTTVYRIWKAHRLQPQEWKALSSAAIRSLPTRCVTLSGCT